MAVVTIPKLPPLSVQKNGKYSYIQTYKNCWDKEKKRSYRLPGSIKTVGKILGGGEEGVIQWLVNTKIFVQLFSLASIIKFHITSCA